MVVGRVTFDINKYRIKGVGRWFGKFGKDFGDILNQTFCGRLFIKAWFFLVDEDSALSVGIRS